MKRVIELVVRRAMKGREQELRLYVPTRRRLTERYEEELCEKFQPLVEEHPDLFRWQDIPVSNKYWDTPTWDYDIEEINELEINDDKD